MSLDQRSISLQGSLIVDIELSPYEARVIGCLIEKESTTPEQYPLSLNALANACNQKSNREPVLDLDEASVQQTVDALTRKRLVMAKTGYGSRVTKYQHRFCNTEFGSLQLSPQERGIICVLLLRGAQTPGELRTRTQRLCEFSDVHEVEAVLDQLMARDDGPLVRRLPREAGKREARYMHCFSTATQDLDTAAPTADAQQPSSSDSERLVQLEQRVNELAAEIQQLRDSLAELQSADLHHNA
jgi:uncharacterized protein YceH (UPF0502 family)